MSSTYTAPRRPRDMLLSLGVILVPILLILGGWRWLSSGTDVSPVDAGPTYIEAADAGLAVLRPKGLSDDWKPTYTAVKRADGGVTMRVSYNTPDGSGVQLVESSVDSAKLLATDLGEAPKLQGDVEVSGAAWMSYLTKDGNAALVWVTDVDGYQRTILVIGDTDQSELLELATSLK